MVSMLAIFAGAKAQEGDFDFVDDCSDITKYWSAPAPANSEGLFIIDSTEKVGEETAPEGQYRFFGKKTSPTYTRIFTDLSTGTGSWVLEFSAKFASLPTLDSLGDIAGWRGGQYSPLALKRGKPWHKLYHRLHLWGDRRRRVA